MLIASTISNLCRNHRLHHRNIFMANDHFDGKKFFTPGAPPVKRFREIMPWILSRRPESWKEEIAVLFPPPPPISQDLRIVFINHSTVLIQINGVNILTDPIWSERASPVSFAGPKRFSRPGIPLNRLPPIHIILLSHNHYDHMDLPTLRYLERQHSPRVYTPLGNARYLKSNRSVCEMDWWEADQYSAEIAIHCTPAQHFSGRGLADRNRALWSSFLIETTGGNIFFSADTAFGSHFEKIKLRFPRIHLALLPIGAYEPRWIMSPVHMSADEAVKAHLILAPDDSIGIHHSTFSLTDEPQYEPRDRIRQLAAERCLRFHVLRNGESWTAEMESLDAQTRPSKTG
jgi:L-ascorbate metabolism protein UlaG (beta-lactamase superfamily)